MAKIISSPDTLLGSNGEPQFELAGWIDTAPFEDLVGIELTRVGEGRSTLACCARVKLAQGGGVVHGGALTTLADTAVAMAIKSLLPEGTVFATTELQMNFIKPVLSGLLRAEAEVTELHERTILGRATIYDDADEEVATFSSVFRIARHQPHVTQNDSVS